MLVGIVRGNLHQVVSAVSPDEIGTPALDHCPLKSFSSQRGERDVNKEERRPIEGRRSVVWSLIPGALPLAILFRAFGA